MCGILRGGGSAALRPVRPDAGLLADDRGLLPPRTLAPAAPASRHAGDLADLRNYGVGAALAGRRSRGLCGAEGIAAVFAHRSEEHTSELQSLMRISYAVFCLKKTTIQ